MRHPLTFSLPVKGFTLVEVMVAMVIGMLGMIIMLQVFSAAEGQKRVTTGEGDLQNNGALALYTLQRDVRLGGYGFNSINVFGCPITIPAPPVARTLTFLAPVIINPPVADVPAGDANTDTLLVAYGRSGGSPEGDLITATGTVGSDQVFSVLSPTNFSVGHRALAAPVEPANGCALTLGTVTDVTSPNVTVAPSNAGEGGSLFNFGTSPRIVAYAIRGGNLTVCDYMQANCAAACVAGNANCNANWTPVANNIVSLRAQYGRDTSTPMDGIDTWDQTTPVQPSPANQLLFACLWSRASALRIALVARNSQPDSGILTALPPVWEGSALNAIDLSARADWQNYRYRVFETVIPLRNLSWMGTALCP
ncbi:PilW family protein [Propionivibrio sp.]|uniref:PilW family protein n=1 Tax=Propionivibrio sp. TaxID=2212460 RepID=UPI002616B2C6|nr:PilW family protein [Propionivibrio sp.]